MTETYWLQTDRDTPHHHNTAYLCDRIERGAVPIAAQDALPMAITVQTQSTDWREQNIFQPTKQILCKHWKNVKVFLLLQE